MIRNGKILLLCLIAAGCGNEVPNEARAMQDDPDLLGTVWQVEDIDAGGIIDRSHVTIEILEPERISGSAGCNRYFGTLRLGGGEFKVSGLGNTSMACVPALGMQEQKFLAALQEAATYEANETFLHIFDAAGKQRIRAVRAPDEVAGTGKVPADAVDPARAVANVFECGDNLSVTVAFVGPETIKISLPDGDHTLQSERSASGARYATEGILFWNKGDEALLDIGGVEHKCKKSSR